MLTTKKQQQQKASSEQNIELADVIYEQAQNVSVYTNTIILLGWIILV